MTYTAYAKRDQAKFVKSSRTLKTILVRMILSIGAALRSVLHQVSPLVSLFILVSTYSLLIKIYGPYLNFEHQLHASGKWKYAEPETKYL